jgi:hypothetical protein
LKLSIDVEVFNSPGKTPQSNAVNVATGDDDIQA